MIKSIKNLIKKEKFNPKLLGFFINHNFNIRRLLYKSIKNNASELSGKILDFGCGSKPYQKLFVNSTQYIGVDYKIEGRSENIDKIDFYYDGKNIPFEANSFDGILCTEVLEHVFNIDELLGEFHRVLKPGGKALITTPFMWEEHEMPYDFARYTSIGIKFLYEKNNFKIKQHFKTGNTLTVFFQFGLNYLKNVLPNNKIVRQMLLLPFIFIFNFLALFLGTLLPTDRTSYFNNIVLIEKK